MAEQEVKSQELVLDLQNTDDLKTLHDFIAEGRVMVTAGHREFIVAEEQNPIFLDNRMKQKTVYLDEITSVQVTKYYEDMLILEAGKRALIREVITVRYRKYGDYAHITPEQLKYLQDKGVITSKNTTYLYIDTSTGVKMYSKQPSEPTKKEVNVFLEQEIAKRGHVIHINDVEEGINDNGEEDE